MYYVYLRRIGTEAKLLHPLSSMKSLNSSNQTEDKLRISSKVCVNSKAFNQIAIYGTFEFPQTLPTSF